MSKDLLLALGFSEETVAKIARVYDEGITAKLDRKGSKQNVNVPRIKPQS